MNRIFSRTAAVLAALVLPVLSGLPARGAEAPAKTPASASALLPAGVLRAGVFAADTPPFYFVNEKTGELDGKDPDLARALAAHLGTEAVLLRFGPPFDDLLETVDSGETDIIISSTSISPARAARYDTIIYDTARFCLLLDLDKLERRLGREVIEPADLNTPEVRILVQRNTPFEAVLREAFPRAVQVPGDTHNDVELMIAALDRDEADAVFDRDLVFLIHQRMHPESAARFLMHVLPDVTRGVGLVLKKNSPLTPIVRAFVAERDEVRELSDIIAEYMTF